MDFWCQNERHWKAKTGISYCIFCRIWVFREFWNTRMMPKEFQKISKVDSFGRFLRFWSDFWDFGVFEKNGNCWWLLIGQKLIPKIKKMDSWCGSSVARRQWDTPGRGQEGGTGGGKPPPWGSKVWKFRTSEERRNGGMEEWRSYLHARPEARRIIPHV